MVEAKAKAKAMVEAMAETKAEAMAKTKRLVRDLTLALAPMWNCWPMERKAALCESVCKFLALKSG